MIILVQLLEHYSWQHFFTAFICVYHSVLEKNFKNILTNNDHWRPVDEILMLTKIVDKGWSSIHHSLKRSQDNIFIRSIYGSTQESGSWNRPAYSLEKIIVNQRFINSEQFIDRNSDHKILYEKLSWTVYYESKELLKIFQSPWSQIFQIEFFVNIWKQTFAPI